MELTFAPYRVKASSGDVALSIRVFQGTPRFSVIDNATNKLVFDRPLTGDKWTIVVRTISKAVNLTPGTKTDLIFSTYNMTTKKVEHDWNFSLMKDERQGYAIAIAWAGSRHVFPLRGINNVSVGSDPMTDADRSALALETLINFVKSIMPFQMVMSNNKEYWQNMRNNRTMSNSGDGNRGGNSYQKPPTPPMTDVSSGAKAEENFF